MAKKKAQAHGGGHGWFVTFADLMGLLVAFFVMLVAGAVFSTLGGLLGAMIFRKTPPVPLDASPR